MSFEKVKELKAYEVVKEERLNDLKSDGCILYHKKSGARICLISNDDDNKVFYIGFRTPAKDSTGVQHIMEHSVLCGSKKYPAKDPFVELVKGSLNTFLNAMTYPDKTVYPVASCNDKDFKNLMDVYLNAVFHPNVYDRPQIFKQEGWHYELKDREDPITINGVVYNEMKGAFSSPDDTLDREIFNSLFPDTEYSNESGGDPDDIPSLTYDAFLKFHSEFYHPSNSYIYLYGNVDFEERLDYIDREYLSSFDRLEIDSKIRIQKPFTKPSDIVKDYPITNDEPEKQNSYLSYNTVISTSLDPKLYVAFQVIEYALLSSPGAVLKQALLDSGICKDVQSMYENGVLQPYLSIIVKNSELTDKEKFKDIIRNELRKVVENGYDKKALLAALNLFEFKFREADFGHYPKGLMYGLQALDSWLYDDKQPFMHIMALDTFAFLREMVETDYFEDLTRKYLLENAHASCVCLVPVRGLTGKKDKELAKRLASVKAEMSDADISKLIEDTKALHAYQEEEDSEEVLKCIPLLEISDIRKEAEDFVNSKSVIEGKEVLFHDLFTNGIGYLTISFDLDKIEDDLLPYVGILKAVLGLVDTEHYSYTDLTNEIFLNSGGIVTDTNIYTDLDTNDNVRHYFEIRSKVFYDKLSFAFEMIREIIYTSNLKDRKRMYELICMIKSRLQMAMMSSGHAVAMKRAASGVSRPDMIYEKISGIDFYRVIESLEKDFDNRFDSLGEKLVNVSQRIFTSENIRLFDYIAEKDAYDSFADEVAEFIKDAPDRHYDRASYDFKPVRISEGYKTSAKVQYVAKVGSYRDKDLPYTGALKVLKTIMGYDYLWNQVRVVGGAYGCFGTFTRTGKVSFGSYRDPNLKRTLDIYDAAADYLENFEASERDMTKYILGTVSDLDFPLSPSAKGTQSKDAYLCNDSFEKIQKERDEILGCTSADIRALAAYVRKMKETASICVLGGEEEIDKEKDLFNRTEPLFMQ